MRRVLLAGLLIALTINVAEARHGHRHHSHHVLIPYSAVMGSAGGKSYDRRRNPDLADLVPNGWQLQPPDSKWKGKRFLSPDGAAWLATYSTPVTDQTIPKHMQAIAFVEGETPTDLRGEQDWISVSGVKGEDRMFYRKAIIACDGRVWHHVAFEYPGAIERAMQRYVSHASEIIDLAENDGCDENATTENSGESQSDNAGARR